MKTLSINLAAIFLIVPWQLVQAQFFGRSGVYQARAESESPGPASADADRGVMTEPVRSVYDNYIRIQTGLAKDSLKGVPEAADSIAKAVRGDSMKMLPSEVAEQADAVATARSLKAARKAFEQSSPPLIDYRSQHNLPGYHEAYCPVTKASWLQKGERIENPYFVDRIQPGTGFHIKNPYTGRTTPICGQIRN